MLQELASAVGYYPQFVLASSLNNMIDLAAVGLIGQKAGFSSNLDTQLKAVRASRVSSSSFNLDLTSSLLRSWKLLRQLSPNYQILFDRAPWHLLHRPPRHGNISLCALR